MSQGSDDIGFEPYQIYRSQIMALEDFAHQSKFCYRITQVYVNENTPPGESSSAAAAPPADTLAQTREDLSRYSFILECAFFEAFAQSTVRALLRTYPAKLASKGSDVTITCDELVQASAGLTSLEQLREMLITRQLERLQASSHPIHGLINFLKREFRLQVDPYSAAYIYKGQNRNASVHDLTEIQDVRTALIYERGVAPPAIIDRYPHLVLRDGVIVINEDYHVRSKAILNAVAFSIGQSIEHHWYAIE